MGSIVEELVVLKAGLSVEHQFASGLIDGLTAEVVIEGSKVGAVLRPGPEPIARLHDTSIHRLLGHFQHIVESEVTGENPLGQRVDLILGPTELPEELLVPVQWARLSVLRDPPNLAFVLYGVPQTFDHVGKLRIPSN